MYAKYRSDPLVSSMKAGGIARSIVYEITSVLNPSLLRDRPALCRHLGLLAGGVRAAS